ncbi:alpha/beta hydrolase [Nonomuraea sp. FMUSA5-5]|uniref:Alpha/beta hydrolase n=1 Tax=Nonomuraea composti TaxID=2720023 RepID=A0ABX1AT60_9ACTN|nr:alpha/beta fold hydrolase [Nonomuraea sp. FMUSA5-5]NJP88809.1 alpha/beta hydrolase [Nonomuraea sp. FMUSA5-5]
MDTVTSPDGTHIAFTRTGEGPAIILVDGAMCFRGAGPSDALAAELASAFSVYTYDRRGRGESTDARHPDTGGGAEEWARASVEAEVDDLVALVGHAGGNAYVFGHSSGAILALEASLRGAGIAGLALFEPPPAGGDDDAELLERLRALVRAGRRGEAVEAFQTAIGLPREMIAGMRQSPFRAVLEGIAPTLAYDAAVANGADPARYAGVTAPVLVLDSEASPGLLRTACEDMAEAVPGAVRRSLPGGFHDVEAGVMGPALIEFFGKAG